VEADDRIEDGGPESVRDGNGVGGRPRGVSDW